MQNFIIFVLSAFFLAIIAFAFLYAYFSRSRNIVREKWDTLLSALRLRLDMIPLLLEVIKKYPDEKHEEIFKDVIELRGNVWPVTVCDKNHIESELEVSAKIRLLFSFGKENQTLNKDTDFLVLKKDFKSIADSIEELTSLYNNAVRTFNGNIFYKLFGGLFKFVGFYKLFIFEFEE